MSRCKDAGLFFLLTLVAGCTTAYSVGNPQILESRHEQVGDQSTRDSEADGKILLTAAKETPPLAPDQHEHSTVRPQVKIQGPTSLAALIAYAVSNNPEIAAARSKAEAMISRVPQARSLEDPMLTTTVFLEEIQTAGGPQEAIVSLSQKFPWFGKLTARGGVAYHDAQMAFAELSNVELAVVEQVKLAYYDLYFINEALTVYEELRPRIEDVIAIARTRYETNAEKVGLESVLQAEVTLHKLQITVAELEQARIKAAARLARAMHLPPGSELDVQPHVDTSTLPEHVDALVAMIERCHPRLEAQRQAITRDTWSVELAEKNYYPDVTVGFNWHEIGERGLSRVANGRDAYSLMVGVNLPIYQAKRDAAVREARFQTHRSAQQYDAVWDELRADVEKLHAQAVEHQRVLRILDEDILRKAQQTFELSVEAYRVDRIGFQQLIDNYEDLLRFRVEQIMRTSSREQAVAQLERAVGCGIAQWPGDEVPQQ